MREEITAKVVRLAIKNFHVHTDLGDTDYTAEDAMCYALGEYDVGYSLDQEGWDNLLGRIKCNL